MSYSPQTIRTPSGESVAVDVEQTARAIWSSALLGSAQSNEADLFLYKRGETVAGDNNASTKANYRHTDRKDGGTMPIDRQLAVVSVAFEFEYNVTATAIGQILDRVYAELFAGSDLPIHRGLVRHYPAGTGVDFQGTATSVAIYDNGDLRSPRFSFPRPVAIRAGSNYRVKLDPQGALSTGSADTLLRCVLRGVGNIPAGS